MADIASGGKSAAMKKTLELGLRVEGIGFRIWGLGFRSGISDLGFRVRV